MTHQPNVGWPFPFVVCRLNRQQNSSHAVRQQWGQNVFHDTYIFAHIIFVRNGIDLVVL